MDLNRFEEIFRLGRVAVGDDEADGTPRMERRFSRRPETVSLLEPNRLRNVGKYVICTSTEVKTKGEVSTSLYENLYHIEAFLEGSSVQMLWYIWAYI